MLREKKKSTSGRQLPHKKILVVLVHLPHKKKEFIEWKEKKIFPNTITLAALPLLEHWETPESEDRISHKEQLDIT